MADISKIKLPSGATYDIKDAVARGAIESLETEAIKGVSENGTLLTPDSEGVVDVNVPITHAEVADDQTILINIDGEVSQYQLLTNEWLTDVEETVGTKTIVVTVSGSFAALPNDCNTPFLFSKTYNTAYRNVAIRDNSGRVYDVVSYNSSTYEFHLSSVNNNTVSYIVFTAAGATSEYSGTYTEISIPATGTGSGYPAMDGIQSLGSEAGYARVDHVHPTDTSRAPLASPSFTGTPTTPDLQSGASGTQVANKNYVDTAISSAQVGSAAFQGPINAQSTLESANYKKGWYWVVKTAGTYAGQSCEIGDFVFAIADKASSYSASDFSVVQANIDMSIFGDLAYEDSATGTYTPAGSVSLTNSNTTATVSKAGSGDATYTPEGSVSLTNSNITTTVSKASSGDATYTPEGSVAAPTISVSTAGSTTTIKNPTKVTVAKTVEAAAPGATAPSNSITYYSVSDETLSLYQLGYTTGDSITTSDVTVKTGDAVYSATAPAFTGTGARLVTGNISVPSSATFSGTGARLVTGNISVPTSASFSGTQATITVTAPGD